MRAMAIALALAVPAAAQDETVTKADQLSLLLAGTRGPAVDALAWSTGGVTDASADGLSAREAAAVPRAEAAMPMMDDAIDPNLPHSPGLYILGAVGREDKMTKISPSTIRPDGNRVTVPLFSARVQTQDRRPIFYAYFDASLPEELKAQAQSAWDGVPGVTATSPRDVLLVRKEEGANWRVARVSARTSVPFDSKEVRPGVFRLQPVVDLIAGEYGFVQKFPASSGEMIARVFDFGVE